MNQKGVQLSIGDAHTPQHGKSGTLGPFSHASQSLDGTSRGHHVPAVKHTCGSRGNSLKICWDVGVRAQT